MRLDEIQQLSSYVIAWGEKGSSSPIGKFYISASSEKDARRRANRQMANDPLQYGFNPKIFYCFSEET